MSVEAQSSSLWTRPADDREDTGRTRPSLWQYDYLVLRFLCRDIVRALATLDESEATPRLAIDIGAGGGPYREMLQDSGFMVRTLDIAPGSGVDIVGTADRTGLDAESVDLIVCTQVLEHTRAPWLAMHEFQRILKPGGNVLLSVPHVWFYHPHPGDYWRVTSAGIIALCEQAALDVRTTLAQGSSAATMFQVVNFLIYGVLGALGAPIYAILNVLGLVADRLIRDERFAMNFVCLATKPTRDNVQTSAVGVI